MSRSFDQLGELQKAVLEALWALGEATVPQVRAHLPQGNSLAYTTVLSVLQKLCALGWVHRRAEGRGHLYRAARSRQEEGARSMQRLVTDIFRGDPLQLFQHLIENESLSDSELDALRKLIDRKRRGGSS